MRSPLAGWTRFPIALIVAIAGALVAVPALATAAPATASISVSQTVAAQAEPIAPAEGELVAGDPVLQWTESDGSGYELRWNAAGDLDDEGALDPAVDGGRTFPGGESHRLTGLTAATYHWQVRALPDGDWSGIATFHLDIQLDTLGPGAVTDEPVTEPTVAPSAPEAGAGLDLSTAVHGFVWIAAGSSFAGLILAVVGREWLRLRRQQES